jgi:hypothetical protein
MRDRSTRTTGARSGGGGRRALRAEQPPSEERSQQEDTRMQEGPSATSALRPPCTTRTVSLHGPPSLLLPPSSVCWTQREVRRGCALLPASLQQLLARSCGQTRPQVGQDSQPAPALLTTSEASPLRSPLSPCLHRKPTENAAHDTPPSFTLRLLLAFRPPALAPAQHAPPRCSRDAGGWCSCP